MVDHSLRQVNSACIHHQAHSKPNVVNLTLTKDYNDKEWHNRDDFDPTAEVAEYHARVLRAQKSECEVDQEVAVYYVLVVHKPSVFLKCDKIRKVVDVYDNIQPAHKQVHMVLKEDEVALCDLLDYNFAYRHAGFFSLPPGIIYFNRLHEIAALRIGRYVLLHVVLSVGLSSF